ncbi:MAG: hypothetical protein IJV72_05085, partial [Clostridia bacterium]|nr:hypothetical protein [Clostridia bacterium]
IVSLGCFCGVAMELERIGLRNCSLPFDWVISGDFQYVLRMIENGFTGFAEKENLYQENNPAYYYDKESHVHFFHDFSPYKSLDEQYEAFKSKYLRRINRFYEIIKKPTIFIRYCGKQDLEYISHNSDEILAILRKFNPQNKIIFISSVEEDFNIDNLYYVEKDVGETIAWKFFIKLPELQTYLTESSTLKYNISNNLKRYKKTKRKRFLSKLYAKIIGIFRKKVYRHSLQYSQLKGGL